MQDGALLLVTRSVAAFATLADELRELGLAPLCCGLSELRVELDASGVGVVLLDHGMEGADAAVRELAERSRVACVVLVERDEEREAAISAGADDVLAAPWTASAIAERVEVVRLRAGRTRDAVRRSLFDAWATHTDDALVILDERGLVVAWNVAAVAVLGHEQRDVLGRPFAELIEVYEELGETPEELVEELLSGDTRASISMRVRGPDGAGAAEFSLNVTQWRDAGRRRVGLRVEEAATHEVEEEMMRLASFPELDPNPVLEFSRAGTLSYMNPATASLPKDAANALIEGVRAVISSFDPDEGVNLVREVEEIGGWFEQHIHYAPAWDSVRVYAQDISERKAAEQRLIDARDNLEQRVRERTSDLRREIDERKNAELRAIEASQAKSVFLATMSHELRTPLNAIIGYTELLHEDNTNPEERDDLQRILLAANHLLGLINDILDLSKIEAGRAQVRYEEVSLRDAVERVAMTVRPIAASRGNQITVSFSGSTGRCWTDPTKLRQVLINLVGNAAKFTEDGAVHVATVVRAQADRTWFEIAVRDTGIGIPAEKLESIFEPFTQADGSTTRLYGGTGLGLAICKKICEMLGGGISVVSELGVGSTFTIRLPGDKGSR